MNTNLNFKCSLIITSKNGTYNWNLPEGMEVVYATGSRDIIRDKNAAVEKSTGDVLIFLDDDAYFENFEEFMREVVSDYGSRGGQPFSDLIAGRIKDHGNTHFDKICSQDMGEKFRTVTKSDVSLGVYWMYCSFKAAVLFFTGQLKQAAPPPWGIGSGTTFVMTRKAFDRVGGFSAECNNVPQGVSLCEDVDLFYRVLYTGGTVTYNPKMVVIHEHNRTTREQAEQRRSEYNSGNVYLARRYKTNPVMAIYSVMFRLLGWQKK